jgi:outer membrane protein assembly factor BamB
VSEHGFGTSPMLIDDLVIVTNDQDGESSLQALKIKDGSIAWRVPRRTREKQNCSYAVPCVYHAAGGSEELIVNSWEYGISAINPRSGATLWELPVFPRRPVGSPVLADGLILGNCGEGSGNNTLVAVRPGASESATPEVVYKLDKTSAPYVPTPLVVSDMVVLWGDKGIVSCIDGATGKLHWRQRVGGNYSGSPVRVGDKVFTISADGEVVVLAAAKEYQLLGRTPLGEASRATPAIVGNRMYLRTESHLQCVQSDL